jgi:hypothetical protein
LAWTDTSNAEVWATDFWHHLSPAAVGATIGLLLTLPGLGVLDLKAIKGVNFLLIVFGGGVVNMTNVLTLACHVPRKP